MDLRTGARSSIKHSHNPDGSLPYSDHYFADATWRPLGRQRPRQTQFYFRSVQKGGENISECEVLKAANALSIIWRTSGSATCLTALLDLLPNLRPPLLRRLHNRRSASSRQKGGKRMVIRAPGIRLSVQPQKFSAIQRHLLLGSTSHSPSGKADRNLARGNPSEHNINKLRQVRGGSPE
jgi:hypothetical protein